MRRDEFARDRPRRIQHAHRIRVPVRGVDERTAPRPGGRGRSGPGLAVVAGLAALALVVATLRPPDGAPESAAEDREGGAVTTPRTGGAVDRGGSAGPRGDAVANGGDASSEPMPSPAASRETTAGPLPPELLTGYAWPLQNARITNSYGLGRPGNFHVDGVTFHDGIDISSFCGARITAAHDGVVLVAGRRSEAYLGWVGDLGPFRERMAEEGWRGQSITVVIDDGNGYRSVYAHLGLAAVDKGEVVRAGDLLGWEGASGNATGCHLHFSLFSPLETATLALDPKVSKRTKLPPAEIARVDPLLVLPPPSAANITWGWGAR